MSIWEYSHASTERIADFYDLYACPFCNTILDSLYGRGLETVDLDQSRTLHIGICQVCGWWNARREVREDVGAYATFVAEQGSYGVLKTLDLKNIELPLQQVRDYLTAKYEARFELVPTLFEQTVGSVFSDHGYIVEVVGKSGDGGIDAILTDGKGQIGVQVKRWKNKVEASAIRELRGAMVHDGITRGMFVTTSSFRSGAAEYAGDYAKQGAPIELYDAPRFFDALRISQIKADRSPGEWVGQILPHLRTISTNTEINEDQFYDDY